MLSALINRAKSVIRILSLALLLTESGYAVSESVVLKWGYGKLNGPPTWTNFFVTCSGLQQSPVALAATEASPISAPALTWKNYARVYGMTLYNTGYTVKLLSSWKTEVERRESTRRYLQDGSGTNRKEVQSLKRPPNETVRTNVELENQLLSAMSQPSVALMDRLWSALNKVNESSSTARSGSVVQSKSLATDETLFSYTTHTLEQGTVPYSTKKRKEKIKQKVGKEHGKSKKGSNKSRITDSSNVNNVSQIDNSNQKPNLRNEHGFAISLRKHYKNRSDKRKISSTPDSKETEIQTVFSKYSSTRAAEEENQNSSTEKAKGVTELNISQNQMLQYLINRYFTPDNVREETNRGSMLSPTSELPPLDSVYTSESSNTNLDTIGLPLDVRYTNLPNENTTYELTASKSMNQNGGPIYTQDAAETSITSLQFLTGVLDHSPPTGIQNYEPNILESLIALSPTTNSLSATTLTYETATEDLLGENDILMKQSWSVGQFPLWSSVANDFSPTRTDPLTEPVLGLFDDDVNTSPQPILLGNNFPTTMFKDAFSVLDGWDGRMDSAAKPKGAIAPNAVVNLGGVGASRAQENVIPRQENSTEECQRCDLSQSNEEDSQNKIQEIDSVSPPKLMVPENDVSVDQSTCETEDYFKPKCTENTENSEDFQYPRIPWINEMNINENNTTSFEVISIPIVSSIQPNSLTDLFDTNAYIHSTTTYSTTKSATLTSIGPSILPSTLIDFLNINAFINSRHISSSTISPIRKPCAQDVLQNTTSHVLNINAFLNSPPVFSPTQASQNTISSGSNILPKSVTELFNTNAFSNAAPTSVSTHSAVTGSQQFRFDLQRHGSPRKNPFAMVNTSILNNNYEFINTFPLRINTSNSSKYTSGQESCSYFFDLSDSTLSEHLVDMITRQENYSDELKDDSSPTENGTIFSRDSVNYPNEVIPTSPTFVLTEPINTSFGAYNWGLGSFPFNVVSESQVEKTTKPCSTRSVKSDGVHTKTNTGSQAIYDERNTNIPQESLQRSNETRIGIKNSYNIPKIVTERSSVGSENVTQNPKIKNHPINRGRTVHILPRNEIQKLPQFSNLQLRGNENAYDCQNTEKLLEATEFLNENSRASTNVYGNLSNMVSPAPISQSMGNVSKHGSGSRNTISPAKRNASFNLSTADDMVLSKIRVTSDHPQDAAATPVPQAPKDTLWTLGEADVFVPQLRAQSNNNNNSKVKNVVIDIEKKQNDKLGIILLLNKLAKGEKEGNKNYFGNRNIADSYSLKPTKPAVFRCAATESLPTKYGARTKRRVDKRGSRLTPDARMFASKPARLFPSLRKKGTSVRMKRFDDTWQSVPQLFLGDDVFVLDSIHFHWGGNDSLGSEHQLNGVRFPLEMNAVHQRRRSVAEGPESDPGKDPQLVVAQFFQVCENCHNHGLEILTRELKDVRRAGASRDVIVPLEELVKPFYRNFYLYHGSLTTPPCTECVTYIVSRNVATAAPRQVALFRELLSPDGNPLVNNFRPLQPRNGRKILMTN